LDKNKSEAIVNWELRSQWQERLRVDKIKFDIAITMYVFMLSLSLYIVNMYMFDITKTVNSPYGLFAFYIQLIILICYFAFIAHKVKS
jgi:hypothetical protein